MMTATLTANRFGLIDSTGHAYRGLTFSTERAAGQYRDRLPETSRRMLTRAGYRLGAVGDGLVDAPPVPSPAAKPQTGRTPRPAVAANACRLTLTIRGVDYRVRANPAAGTGRAYRLRKADGSVYDVAETPHGPTCDCADQTFRHEGIDPCGCKHIRSLRAVGLIR